MFVGFNLSLRKNDELMNMLYESENIGKRLYQDQKQMVRDRLDKYINPDGSLSATRMEEDWFAGIPANVFLSHSHEDVTIAIQLAGYLWKKCGIKCFIDSCVWGYADDLLEMIDEEYCKNAITPEGSYTYNYQFRNRSTSHVHILLNGALAKMINRTECLIFLNTPNSIKASDTKDSSKTASPWIYSELLMATVFPHRKLSYYRLSHHREDSIFYESKTPFQVEYDVHVEKLVELNMRDFEMAIRRCGKVEPENVLDQLYLQKGLLRK